jgi:hypothetical protein
MPEQGEVMSKNRPLLSTTFVIALLAGVLPTLASDEQARVAEAAQFRPAPPAQKVVILKVKVVEPDMSFAFRVDETLHTSKLTTGELFRQMLIDMPLPQGPVQASTPRTTTDGRGK